MSIAARMASYSLLRSDNQLDDYGIMSSTPTLVSSIQVSITKNQPAHDIAKPAYDITPYVGITAFVGVEIGDILEAGNGTKYQVKDIGNRGTLYIPLFLVKL